MPSEARQKKIIEKLNRAPKCSILGPQNLGSRGDPGPRAPPPGSAPGKELLILKTCLEVSTQYTSFLWPSQHTHEDTYRTQ